MIWAYLRTGSPAAIAWVATLWPEGIADRIAIRSTSLPGDKLRVAVTTVSARSNRTKSISILTLTTPLSQCPAGVWNLQTHRHI